MTPDQTDPVRISGLHKSFGSNKVLKGVDLTVSKGEVVCIIGASGSGKSTLLRCVNGLETASSGSIQLFGEEVTDPDTEIDDLRAGAGMGWQDVTANGAQLPRLSDTTSAMIQ